MIRFIKNRLRKEAFEVSLISIIVNPFYIIRNGLYKAISKQAMNLTGEILDFGCGNKPYEHLFINAKTYVGVDIKKSGHDHKNSKVDKFYDGKNLPFPDNSFDSVVSFEVFEHIFNIDEILSEIHRVLKPDGKLLITIPFAWDEHEAPFDYARYTSFGIKNILEKNLFEISSQVKTTTYVLATFQMFIAYLSQYIFSKNNMLRIFGQLLIIFPLNILAIFFNFLLPKRYEYYSNQAILAKRVNSN